MKKKKTKSVAFFFEHTYKTYLYICETQQTFPILINMCGCYHSRRVFSLTVRSFSFVRCLWATIKINNFYRLSFYSRFMLSLSCATWFHYDIIIILFLLLLSSTIHYSLLNFRLIFIL
jgi:hypothetical protein